jgi:hypothetical protein
MSKRPREDADEGDARARVPSQPGAALGALAILASGHAATLSESDAFDFSTDDLCRYKDLEGLAAMITAREASTLSSPFTVFVSPWVPALSVLPLDVVVDMWVTAAYLDCDEEATMRFLKADLLQRRLRGEGSAGEWSSAFALPSDLEVVLQRETKGVVQRVQEKLALFVRHERSKSVAHSWRDTAAIRVDGAGALERGSVPEIVWGAQPSVFAAYFGHDASHALPCAGGLCSGAGHGHGLGRAGWEPGCALGATDARV